MSEPVTTAAAQYYGFWRLALVGAAVWGLAVIGLLVGIYRRLG